MRPLINRPQKIRNAEGFVFLHDLSPVIAARLSQSGMEFKPEELPAALRFVFEKQVFRSSYRAAADDEADIVRCPFSASFAKTMSLRFDEQAGGALRARQGAFGDTLLFLMDKIDCALSAEKKADVVVAMELAL